MVPFGRGTDRAGVGVLMLGVGTGAPSTAARPPTDRASEAIRTVAAPGRRMTTEERAAWAVLASVEGVGPVAFSALLACFGSGAQVLAEATAPGGAARIAATPAEPGGGRRPVSDGLARAICEAAAATPLTIQRLAHLGITVVTTVDPTYPVRLATVAMPPHVLYVQGDPTSLGRPRAVAVVGTRRATTSGRTTAGRIATALVAAEAIVVSGLAYGIDGAAHEATIQAGGTTAAVIGGGHVVAIPAGHGRLAERILATGGAILSELPPDAEPTKGTFPRRNRVISGLADATVVVEAPARSGALITASWAIEQGRGCYLVPGSLDAPASAGCLAFLREFVLEARVVAGIPQLIADLGMTGPLTTGVGDRLTAAALQELGSTETAVAGSLLSGMATVDELVAATDLPVAAVLATLALLERRGLVLGIHGRYRPAGALLGEPARNRP